MLTLPAAMFPLCAFRPCSLLVFTVSTGIPACCMTVFVLLHELSKIKTGLSGQSLLF